MVVDAALAGGLRGEDCRDRDGIQVDRSFRCSGEDATTTKMAETDSGILQRSLAPLYPAAAAAAAAAARASLSVRPPSATGIAWAIPLFCSLR